MGLCCGLGSGFLSSFGFLCCLSTYGYAVFEGVGVDRVGADDGNINVKFIMTYTDNKVDSVVVVSLCGGSVLFVHAVAIEF